MLFITNNSDFFRMDSEFGILLFLFNRNEISDYSEILSIATPVTEDEAAKLINEGAAVQATVNSITPLKGEAITGATNATD